MDEMQISARGILILVFTLVAVRATSNETLYNDPLTDNQSDLYANITGGNKLWNGILRECKTASLSCIQKNVYHYLDDTFQYRGDVNFGGFMHFTSNKVDYSKYTREANNHVDDDDDEEDLEEERSITPLEEVTRALHNKSVGFLMTHDVELQLPETLFEGSTLKISPRSFEGEGVLVKLDLIPRELKEVGTGRILFKKIKKFFKNKLVMAFMSIFLVISLVKSVLMFFMPLVVGVGTAKKILLKVLLFVFPALSHLFKLCTYYHDSYHGTKYHHHHHQIAHVHHLPSLHHTLPDIHPHEGPPGYKHEHDNFEFSGPGLGPEYISNRNAYEQHTPSTNDENVIKSWGLGHVQGQKGNVRRGHQPKPGAGAGGPITVNQIEELALQAEKEVLLKTRLQQEQQRIRQENLKLQEQLQQELKLHEQLKLQAMMLAQQKTKLQPQAHQSQLHHQVVQAPMQPQMQVPVQHHHQQQQLQHQYHKQQAIMMAKQPVYDSFYSPILERIDKIFNSIGIGEETCRERLVCSMYKNPLKFSPHSNLLSAELSRDSKELQKPTSSNEAVVRFYRYVQAARDGQDQRECLRLYPSCNINTEL